LEEVLADDNLRSQMIAAVCALEGCTHATQQLLCKYSPVELASCLLSGTGNDKSVLFAPIPNFIFTRDIGIVVKDHLILNKPAKIARHRETLLARYIFFHHPMFIAYRNNIIELKQNRPVFLMPENDNGNRITLEGGDVMVVSPEHLIVGISERTSAAAAAQLTEALFQRGLVSKVSIVKIPAKRDYMHIDTIFTQVKKDVWVMMGLFSEQMSNHYNQSGIEKTLLGYNVEKAEIVQFNKANPEQPTHFSSLEALLRDISIQDLGCSAVKIIFSGNNEYPYAVREQWTDSCNLLALKEGVVLSYDRNEKRLKEFNYNGYVFGLVQDKFLIADGMIVECIFNKDLMIFEVYRPRYDKSSPNAMNTALDTFKDMLKDPKLKIEYAKIKLFVQSLKGKQNKTETTHTITRKKKKKRKEKKRIEKKKKKKKQNTTNQYKTKKKKKNRGKEKKKRKGTRIARLQFSLRVFRSSLR
jgi:arginine deiminase